MPLLDMTYGRALDTFEGAVVALCAGDRQRGDGLLHQLDAVEIERDRAQLLAFARTARFAAPRQGGDRASRSIPRLVKRAVQRRDMFHCRFTGRRLVDTRVFQEVARLSDAFHFDAHHSVSATARGPGGHPMVRTHGAAYEHVEPLSCGGGTTVENIVLTSVQLNESKGARILEVVGVPHDGWAGLTEYLHCLRQVPAAPRLAAERASSGHTRAENSPVQGPVSAGRHAVIARLRAAVLDSHVTIYATADDGTAEETFQKRRENSPNEFFLTTHSGGHWIMHRLYCSSLVFAVPRNLTTSPKVCAEDQDALLAWAERLGVTTAPCSRCLRPR